MLVSVSAAEVEAGVVGVSSNAAVGRAGASGSASRVVPWGHGAAVFGPGGGVVAGGHCFCLPPEKLHVLGHLLNGCRGFSGGR